MTMAGYREKYDFKNTSPDTVLGAEGPARRALRNWARRHKIRAKNLAKAMKAVNDRMTLGDAKSAMLAALKGPKPEVENEMVQVASSGSDSDDLRL
jgi:hypothetical protein